MVFEVLCDRDNSDLDLVRAVEMGFGIWDEAKIGKEKRVRLSSAMVLCHVYHKIATSHASVIF
jgi:hypothetical protein